MNKLTQIAAILCLAAPLTASAAAPLPQPVAELECLVGHWKGTGSLTERANAELEALTAELERAFGLSGRERRVGGASERARSNVQRRISHAIGQIRAASPQLGQHLALSVKTGMTCCYTPQR